MVIGLMICAVDRRCICIYIYIYIYKHASCTHADIITLVIYIWSVGGKSAGGYEEVNGFQ
jgi:hypothetical protein